jgi:hypothetical protein
LRQFVDAGKAAEMPDARDARYTFTAHCAPAFSASVRMERSFRTSKGLPSRPTRVWR